MNTLYKTSVDAVAPVVLEIGKKFGVTWGNPNADGPAIMTKFQANKFLDLRAEAGGNVNALRYLVNTTGCGLKRAKDIVCGDVPEVFKAIQNFAA